MLKRQAFKFELIPNGEQTRRINQFCGCSRFVFNRGLDWQNTQYAQDNSITFSYTKIANLLPQWKKAFPWLKDCYSQVLQQSLKDLENAFKNFFHGKTSSIPLVYFILCAGKTKQYRTDCRKQKHGKPRAGKRRNIAELCQKHSNHLRYIKQYCSAYTGYKAYH